MWLRVVWTFAEWFSNLFFFLRVDKISNDKYTFWDLLPILYLTLFVAKSGFWIYTFYHVIYNEGYFQVRTRVVQLWLLSIFSTLIATIIMETQTVQSNPYFFIIIVMHIAPITKQCFVLGSFPFNIYFQYSIAIIFATDVTLIFPSNNVLKYNSDYRELDYVKFAVFLMCMLFLAVIACRPLLLLFEGKYPKFIKPVYRDYYDSEDGGWRNEYSQREETAISNIKSHLLKIPTTHTMRDEHLYGIYAILYAILYIAKSQPILSLYMLYIYV